MNSRGSDDRFGAINSYRSVLRDHTSGWWMGVPLLVLAVFRSHLGTRLDSFTVDEPYHIVAGTSYVRTGDFRLNPEHPPLMKLWLGASEGGKPALFS